jgi:hypothetical protein
MDTVVPAGTPAHLFDPSYASATLRRLLAAGVAPDPHPEGVGLTDVEQVFYTKIKFAPSALPLKHSQAKLEWAGAMQDLERAFWNWLEGVNACWDAQHADEPSSALQIDAQGSSRVVAAEAGGKV